MSKIKAPHRKFTADFETFLHHISNGKNTKKCAFTQFFCILPLKTINLPWRYGTFLRRVYETVWDILGLFHMY